MRRISHQWAGGKVHGLDIGSAIHAVIQIVLYIFTDLKLERIIGRRSTLFADLNLEITEKDYMYKVYSTMLRSLLAAWRYLFCIYLLN